MNLKLMIAFKQKDYDTIFLCLRPLFYKHLKHVPIALHNEFLQEYYLACIKIIENFRPYKPQERKDRCDEWFCKYFREFWFPNLSGRVSIRSIWKFI